MKRKLYTLLVLSFLMMQGVLAEPAMLKIWHGDPIDIALPVGQTRLLHFSMPVSLPDSASYRRDVQLEYNQQLLAIRAKKPFKEHAITVLRSKDQQPITLHLHALEGAATSPLNIIIDPYVHSARPLENLSLSDWFRYGILSLYGPARLNPNPWHIGLLYRYASQPFNLSLAGEFISIPIATWYHDAWQLTAIKIKNMHDYPIDLDPHLLCVKGRAVSFFPYQHLAPYHHLGDESTVFLLSKQDAYAYLRKHCQGAINVQKNT